MNLLLAALVVVPLAVGVLFVAAGTLGVLRFGDLETRLHAVAKADNVGLGLITLALVVHALTEADGDGGTAGVVGKLVLVWLLALLGTAANSHLLAREERS